MVHWDVFKNFLTYELGKKIALRQVLKIITGLAKEFEEKRSNEEKEVNQNE